jgi:hypothetical protein
MKIRKIKYYLTPILPPVPPIYSPIADLPVDLNSGSGLNRGYSFEAAGQQKPLTLKMLTNGSKKNYKI